MSKNEISTRLRSRSDAARMGGRPKMITNDMEAEMKRLRTEGLSIRRIAATVGVSKVSVQKLLEREKQAAL